LILNKEGSGKKNGNGLSMKQEKKKKKKKGWERKSFSKRGEKKTIWHHPVLGRLCKASAKTRKKKGEKKKGKYLSQQQKKEGIANSTNVSRGIGGKPHFRKGERRKKRGNGSIVFVSQQKSLRLAWSGGGGEGRERGDRSRS